MKVGISTYAYTWAIGVPSIMPDKPMDIHQFIEAAVANGVDLLQIADNLPLHALSDSELLAVKNHLKQLSLSVEIGIRGLTDTMMERYLGFAEYFQSPILRVVTDLINYTPTIQEIIAILERWVPVAKANNITLALENHDRFKVSDLIQIVSKFDVTEVGICLDTVNSLGALEGPDTVIKGLAPYTVNVHLKDFKISRPLHSMGFIVEGTIAGEGMLNIQSIFANPILQTRNPNVILELWTPFESTIGETVTKENDWVKKSIQNLKKLGLL
ncbi:TIM barrel protein [uncultured Sphaerochaeta sp.]|uniref:sugar phosphate isomerase/epimerase family protein n=1 Tax=uncultured Sphaerochaeta sp. TaxID=886478 RepID=UPI002A0AA055|nr:TIM barrel protein [uncultured Sphaerochaeta sp.]